jgi:beta propeller repeat protein
MARLLRLYLLAVILSIPLLTGFFTHMAYADQLSGDPSDAYVFGADSAVDPFGNSQYHPALTSTGGRIYAIWEDNRPVEGLQNFSRIFYRDITDLSPGSGELPPSQMLTASGPFTGRYKDQENPAADGALVAWEEAVTTPGGGRGVQIYYTYLGDPYKHPLSPNSHAQSNPDVSGTRVVWQDERAGTRQDDIYLYDLATGAETPVATDPGSQISPRIDGDWVVWISNDNYNVYGVPQVNDLFARNLATGQVVQITDDSGAVRQESPAIKDGKVVWAQSYYGMPEVGIYMYDLSHPETPPRPIYEEEAYSPEIEKTTETNPDGTPRDSYRVVWNSSSRSSTGSPTRVMLADLSSERPTVQTVTAGQADVFAPVILGDRIAWYDARSGHSNLYQNRIGERAQELAERYRPELRMTMGENFEPMPVEQFLTAPGTTLRKRNDSSFSILNPAADVLAQYAGTPDLYVDLQGDSIAAGGGDPSRSIDHGKVRDEYAKPYQNRRDEPGSQFPRMIYARVVSRPDGDTNSFIQYWLFYYANDHAELFHEGDWEVVQVELDGELKPYRVDYSQHDYGQWRNWDGPGSVEKSEAFPDQPVVYVALGSHANYFSADAEHSINWHDRAIPKVWDDASASGNYLNNPDVANPLFTQVKVIPETDQVASGSEFEWLLFNGQWGEYTGANVGIGPDWSPSQIGGLRDGPDNPPIQGNWTNAFAWNNIKCDGCEDEAGQGTEMECTALSPVDIHLYDSQGRHTGKNPDGSIDQEIPGSEYLEYPDLHRKSIIVHGGDIDPGYRFEATGSGSGSADLIVTAPDRPGGSVDTLYYNGIEVNPQTSISMNLDSTRNYNAAVDAYGDGASVTDKAPDSIITNSVDFTPPAPVSDLAVSDTGSGSATLIFTAPGDDMGVGTATAYDLRYWTSPITEENWQDAVPVSSLPDPLAAGSSETITVNGLDAGTGYYFALKAMDESGLFSPLSNVASGTTTIPELTWAIQRVYWESWDDYYAHQLSIDYDLSNAGSGAALGATIQASLCVPDTIYTVTGLPLAAGDIEPGANSIVTLKYYIPAGVGSFTTTTYASCLDDAGREYWFPGPLP